MQPVVLAQHRVAPFKGLAEQRYETYTSEDQEVWRLLFARMAQVQPGKAATAYLKAIPRVGFQPDAIPDFEALSLRLRRLTGWEVVPVEGIIDPAPFFRLLEQRIFPAGYWIRSLAQLDYLEEPDLFHDVFGHVPLLSEPAFADFFQGFGELGARYADHPFITELMARLYWFTVEFGLIQEAEGLRIYGAGILSSSGEIEYCLGPVPTRVPFDLQTVLKTPFRKDTFQTTYFAIQDYHELYTCLPELVRILAAVEEHSRAHLAQAIAPEAVAGVATRLLEASLN